MAKAKKRAPRGAAFGLQTGLARFTEVARFEPLAVDARTICELLGYRYSTETMRRLVARGLPDPINPAGGEKRWVVSEIKTWLSTCERAPESYRPREVAVVREPEVTIQ